MSRNALSPDDLCCAPGMDVTLRDGVYELRLSEPVGSGTMRARTLSPAALCATVDFACTSCPSIAISHLAEREWFTRGTWFTCNLCLEGRCEVSLPPEGFAVVAAGDFCVSCTKEYPHEYRYPSGRYRGIELFVNTLLAEDPGFALLSRGPATLEDIARDAGIAAVISDDDALNGPMVRLGSALESGDEQFAALELLLVLSTLQRRDLSCAKPRVMLTRAQMNLVRRVRDELESSLDAPHDARDLARASGVSAATLNSHFSNLYGETIASYLRRRRMERGRDLLAQGLSVADVSLRVGYANPSKFAAAFKRAFGETPCDARLRAQLG